MIRLSELIVMQAEIRPRVPMKSMIQFVKNGNSWTKQLLAAYAKEHGIKTSPLIQISRFEDGSHYIHDGHHRTVATFLGGRGILFDTEYEVTNWTYDLYLGFNPDIGWLTPFDPRTHVRFSDVTGFKQVIRRLLQQFPKSEIEPIVRSRSELYSSRRSFNSVVDLASTYRE